MFLASVKLELCRATEEERNRLLPGDSLVASPVRRVSHAITIDATVDRVWPWLIQLGSGRAGWYSYDRIDNGGQRSRQEIVPELQSVKVGDVLPAIPGTSDAFLVREVEAYKALVLVVPIQTAAEEQDDRTRMMGPLRVAWSLILEPIGEARTRLISRGNISAAWLTESPNAVTSAKPVFIERVYSVLAKTPRSIMLPIASLGHYVMESRMLRGIKLRAERQSARQGYAARRPGNTPQFRGMNGEILPDSIAKVSYLRLGGLDQWVMIRGESLGNPPLIMLHGGPGFSDTAFFRHFNAALEKSFTVVYWDQRGTGKSFDRHIPKASMTVEQFIADLDELVQHVLKLTGRDKVALFGHSWGSALGVLYAARFPAKVATYVGSGQIGDWPAGEAASYAFAMAEAERRNNVKASMALRAIGPPPYPAASVFTERMWVQRLTNQMTLPALWKMRWILRGTPESSPFELPHVLSGFRFSMEAMWPEVSVLNLMDIVPALEMPVFFFIGLQDHWVPPETSFAYFEKLTAPAKTFEWFETSAHEPFADEPAKFNALMVELVRPALVRG